MDETNIKRIFNLLCEKIGQYDDNNYWDFFMKDSDDFFALISLVYMLLVKESIITKNKKDTNIYSRLKLNIDESYLDELIDNNGLRYLCDKSGKDSKWLYDAIRDSILHNMPIIDFDNKRVHIKNDLKKIECDISFDFFMDIAGRHFSDGVIIKPEEYITNAFILDYDVYLKLYGDRFIMDFSDFTNFDEFVKYAMKIKRYIIKFKPKTDNIYHEGPIFDDSVTYQSLNWFNATIDSYVDYCCKYTFDFLKSRHDVLDNIIEYNKNFDAIFCCKMKELLNKECPNIDFEITLEFVDYEKLKKIYDQIMQRDMSSLRKDSKSKHYLFARHLIEAHKQSDRRMLLGAFNDLILSVKFAKKIYNEYDEVAKTTAMLLLNCQCFFDDIIHNIRKQYGLTNNDTYDKLYVRYGKNIDNRYIYITDNEFNKLNEFFQYNVSCKDEHLYSFEMSDIKNIDRKIYDKYTDVFRKTGTLSDQDIAYLSNESISYADTIKSLLYKYHYVMPMLFLHVLGTGIYSINKDSIFLNNANFVDILDKNIECYSSSYYNSNKNLLPGLPDKINLELEKLQKMQEGLEKCTTFEGKEKIKKSIVGIEKNIKKYRTKLNARVIQVNNVKYQETDINEKLSRIRDAFSHLDRVKLLDFNSKEIELIDYNDSLQPVAIIKTNIDSFFNIFKSIYANDVLDNQRLNK